MTPIKAIPEKTIAKSNHVSPSTVSRNLHSILFERKTNTKSPPKKIMMDELKRVKDTEGVAMSFIFADVKTHEIQDILPDRTLCHLEAHFRQFHREVRDKVETVTMDMYSPYIQLVQVFFRRLRSSLIAFMSSGFIFGHSFKQEYKP